MSAPTNSDLAAFVARVSLGIMYLAHSVVLKLMTSGLAGTAHLFVAIGLPAWPGYVTFAAEALGGSLLILGVHTRWIAIALTPALLGAII
jgi:putative oxidoreductase